MPFIDPQARIKVAVDGPGTSGELCYELYQVCKKYLANVGEKFQTYSDILGALRTVELVLYDHHMAQYEEDALHRNGDVNGED